VYVRKSEWKEEGVIEGEGEEGKKDRKRERERERKKRKERKRGNAKETEKIVYIPCTIVLD